MAQTSSYATAWKTDLAASSSLMLAVDRWVARKRFTRDTVIDSPPHRNIKTAKAAPLPTVQARGDWRRRPFETLRKENKSLYGGTEHFPHVLQISLILSTFP